MPVFLLAISKENNVEWGQAIGAFFILHLLVYPSSNGYNSYIDRDETSIGGLEKPPMPTKKLYYITIIMDSLAVLLSFLCVNATFAACLLLYIGASRAYSSPQIRLKKYPFAGFGIVILFQGAFTYFITILACRNEMLGLTTNEMLILTATSLQIAGAYPLTQVYQHEADRKDGVTTISYVLGYNGTFVFSALMLLLCNLFYGIYFYRTEQLYSFYLLELLFCPPLVYFIRWFRDVLRDSRAANFKNTMRMNLFSAASMLIFSFVLLLLKHFR